MDLERVELHRERYPTVRCYPFNIPSLQNSSRIDLAENVVFFVGENGSGKSTLLDAIARNCGIELWDKPKRHLAHHNPYETRLADYIDVVWSDQWVPGSIFRAETFRDFADFLDDVALCDPGRLAYHGGQLLNTLSHGQGILSYLGGRYRFRGLYLLDEPEAALSPASQVKFVQLLQELGGQGHAQFIVATHSPILLACPGAQILDFDAQPIREIAYRDTTHYRVYQQFLADPNRYFAPPNERKEDRISTKRPSADTLSVPAVC